LVENPHLEEFWQSLESSWEKKSSTFLVEFFHVKFSFEKIWVISTRKKKSFKKQPKKRWERLSWSWNIGWEKYWSSIFDFKSRSILPIQTEIFSLSFQILFLKVKNYTTSFEKTHADCSFPYFLELFLKYLVLIEKKIIKSTYVLKSTSLVIFMHWIFSRSTPLVDRLIFSLRLFTSLIFHFKERKQWKEKFKGKSPKIKRFNYFRLIVRCYYKITLCDNLNQLDPRAVDFLKELSNC